MEASGSKATKRLDDFTIQLEEEGNNSVQQAQRTLVGKVLSEKSLNRGAIKHILSKAWGEPENLQMSDVGMNLFMFIFKEPEEAQVVLKNCPWYVMNKLLSLQQWTPQAVIKEIDFSKALFWVQVHGLPVEFMNPKNATKILSHLGSLEEVEQMRHEEQLVRHFIRARICINIQHPLSTGCWVPRNNLPKVWISFKYEKLQDLCFNCGVIGHEQRFCKEDKETPSRYGQRLSVPPAKEWSLILEERKKWQQRSRENTRSNPASNQNDFQNNDRTQQDALVVRQKEHVRREGVSFDGVGEERLQMGGMASASRRAQQ